jgi:hypothetical protein
MQSHWCMPSEASVRFPWISSAVSKSLPSAGAVVRKALELGEEASTSPQGIVYQVFFYHVLHHSRSPASNPEGLLTLYCCTLRSTASGQTNHVDTEVSCRVCRVNKSVIQSPSTGLDISLNAAAPTRTARRNVGLLTTNHWKGVPDLPQLLLLAKRFDF